MAAAAVETCKPVETSTTVMRAVPPRPKRDFAREHREYLRNIQKSQQAAKAKSARIVGASAHRDPNFGIGATARARAGGIGNENWKSDAFNRSTIKMDRPRAPAERRMGTFISRNLDQRKRAGGVVVNQHMADKIIQTCDPEEGSFLEGTVLSPSDYVLEAIRAKNQPPPEPPKPKPIKRRVDRHTCVLNAHLSDLKEFLEKGSVSRRKRTDPQNNPNLQKYLVRGRLNVRGRASRPNIDLDSKKTLPPKRLMDNIKSTILFGSQGQTGLKNSAAVKTGLTKLASKNETIGDGPKHSQDNKLIVVYQKE